MHRFGEITGVVVRLHAAQILGFLPGGADFHAADRVSDLAERAVQFNGDLMTVRQGSLLTVHVASRRQGMGEIAAGHVDLETGQSMADLSLQHFLEASLHLRFGDAKFPVGRNFVAVDVDQSAGHADMADRGDFRLVGFQGVNLTADVIAEEQRALPAHLMKGFKRHVFRADLQMS